MHIKNKLSLSRLMIASTALMIFTIGCSSSSVMRSDIESPNMSLPSAEDNISTIQDVVLSSSTTEEEAAIEKEVGTTLILPTIKELSNDLRNNISTGEVISHNLWDSISCAYAKDFEKNANDLSISYPQVYHVGGRIYLTEGGRYGQWNKAESVEFFPIMVSEKTQPRDIRENNKLYLQLEDIDGYTLSSRSVETLPHPHDSESSGPYTFWAEFVLFSGTVVSELLHTISLVDNSEPDSPRVIDSISRSENAPDATIVQPSAGQRITGKTLLLEWNANDLDSDELTYRTWYSTDDGKSYSMIDMWFDDSNSRELNLYASPRFESYRARFAVSVSDGFQSIFVESPTFCVPRINPQFHALNVDDETMFFRRLYGDQAIVLSVTGDSEEAQEYEFILFDWHSDELGFLGNGSSILLSDTALEPGSHIITAIGETSSGKEVTVSARINFNW